MGLENLPTIELEETDKVGAHAKLAAHAKPAAFDADPFEGLSSQPLRPKRRGGLKVVIGSICVVALVGAGVAFALNFGRSASESKSSEAMATTPETVWATVKVNNVFVPDAVLKRGDTLQNVKPATELTGSYANDYYRAVHNGKTVYIAKNLVRTSSEAAPEQWTGYAAEGATIFSKPDFSGDDILTLQLNEEVTVLDSFGNLLFVRNADGFEGYMPADKVMREKAPEASEPEASDGGYVAPSYGYGYSYGGGSSSAGGGSAAGAAPSGGSSSGGGVSAGGGASSGGQGSSTGATVGDGDEMTMPVSASVRRDPFLLGVGVAYADEMESKGSSSSSASDADSEEVTAIVLADGAQTYSCILNRGDEVLVKVDDSFGFSKGEASGSESASNGDAASSGSESSAGEPSPRGASDDDVKSGPSSEDFCTVVVNECEVQLPERILSIEGSSEYESWTGYATDGALLYSDYLMTNEAAKLSLNQEVEVIDSIGNALVVKFEGGVYCVDAASVSNEKHEEPQPEAEEAAAGDVGASAGYTYYEPQYNYGGGSSSGGGNAGSDAPSSGGAVNPAPAPGGNGGGAATAPSTDEGEWTPPKL